MRGLDPGLNQSHNGYIELYLNLGLVGLTLLAILTVRGYRNIVVGLLREQARTVSSLLLAYFVVGLIYNCTESGFKMMSTVWIFFLLASTVTPKALLSESPSPLSIDLTTHLAECGSRN